MSEDNKEFAVLASRLAESVLMDWDKEEQVRLAKEVAKRTSNAITHTKLSFAINEVQNKVKDTCSEIGKLVYKKYLDGEDFPEEFSPFLTQIDTLMEEENTLTDKLNELKKSIVCPDCGAMIYCTYDFLYHDMKSKVMIYFQMKY